MNPADVFAAARWWLTVSLLGLAAWPIVYRVLSPLSDRGYALSRLIGLLIFTALLWSGTSFGLFANDAAGLLAAGVILVALAVLSLTLPARDGTPPVPREIVRWIRDNWKYVLISEILLATVYAIWVLVRAHNPAITATEKPMEIAFLNSVGRSTSFPPADPWLSGFSISYYYFGYVMTSVVARLSSVPNTVAYNLATPWIAATTAMISFSVVVNAVRAAGRKAGPLLYSLAIVAAFAIPTAGNLEIVAEVLHENGVGSDSFWQWLDVRDLQGPANETGAARYEKSDWWWWRSSRVIHEYTLAGVAEEGLEPIAEFPAFSFVLADLHPHVLALPYALLSISLALAWMVRLRTVPVPRLTWREVGQFPLQLGLGLLLLTLLALGALAFLNTWDLLIYVVLISVVYVVASWRRGTSSVPMLPISAILLAMVLVIGAVAFFLPFYFGLRSQAGAPFLLPFMMRPTRLSHLAIIFGAFLLPIYWYVASGIVSLRGADLRKRLAETAAYATAILALFYLLWLLFSLIVATSPEGAGQVNRLAADLGVAPLAPAAPAQVAGRILWAFKAMGALLPAVMAVRLQYGLAQIFLALLAGASIATLRTSQRDSESVVESADRKRHSFILVLILVGTLLLLFPEFLYIKDNFGQRLNTVFKFYYQAWLMYGLAAALSSYYLFRDRSLASKAIAGLFVVLVGASLMFPFFASQSRAQEHAGYELPGTYDLPSLDGMAFMQVARPDEYRAIVWLRDHAEPGDVVLEATGGQYSSYGRVSAFSGVPTVLGWAGHEYQWRGSTPEPAIREADVQSAYLESSWPIVRQLLEKYSVSYIFFGELEQIDFGAASLDRLSDHLEIAFESGDVTILKYPPLQQP